MADQGIKDKLKALLKDQMLKAKVDSKFSLEHHDECMWNLEALKNSTPMPFVATMGGEGTPLITCHIGHFEGGEFLNIYGRLKFLCIREGYDELYEDIQALWKTDGANKVVLVGNAGTGKSWYQLYILRRLLKRSTDYQYDADDYDFVFHQVGHQHYLIDIKDCVVYQVNSLDVGLLKFLARSLYFFEPGAEPELAPTIVGLPSLATLSPYGKRISEYRKFGTMLLYFWPWSFTEMCAMVEHSGLGLDITPNDLYDRYLLYGGIVHHVVAPTLMQKQIKKDLVAHLENLDLKAANVDRDATGNNVSGFILCYDGKRVALEQKSQEGKGIFFNGRVLRYTSAFVEQRVEEVLDRKPMEEKMMVVLDRLNDRIIDLSGKNLEAVTTEFLSKAIVKWQIKRAGVGGWSDFTTKKRTVTKDYSIVGQLTKADQLLVPTNTSFPVADMVFSKWGNDPALVFQCTWQPSHPFTVQALYELRVKHLRVPASKAVYIIMVAPDQEEKYATKPEANYLSNSVDEALQYTRSETVGVSVLQEMWSHTEVHILLPKQSWKGIIESWLVPHSQPAPA